VAQRRSFVLIGMAAVLLGAGAVWALQARQQQERPKGIFGEELVAVSNEDRARSSAAKATSDLPSTEAPHPPEQLRPSKPKTKGKPRQLYAFA
jgi:cytoskeletal protein RodZ